MTDYIDLKAAVDRWAERDHSDIVDDCIRIVESRLGRVIRTQDMSTRAQVTFNAGQFLYSWPSDAVTIRNIEVQRDSNRRIPLSLMSPEALDVKYGAGEASCPLAYTVTGRKFEIRPCPNQDYIGRIIYKQKIPGLIENGTNWLIQQNFDIYLWGCLYQAAKFVRDDEAAQMWGQMFGNATEELNLSNEFDEWSGATPSVESL